MRPPRVFLIALHDDNGDNGVYYIKWLITELRDRGVRALIVKPKIADQYPMKC